MRRDDVTGISCGGGQARGGQVVAGARSMVASALSGGGIGLLTVEHISGGFRRSLSLTDKRFAAA